MPNRCIGCAGHPVRSRWRQVQAIFGSVSITGSRLSSRMIVAVAEATQLVVLRTYGAPPIRLLASTADQFPLRLGDNRRRLELATALQLMGVRQASQR